MKRLDKTLERQLLNTSVYELLVDYTKNLSKQISHISVTNTRNFTTVKHREFSLQINEKIIDVSESNQLSQNLVDLLDRLDRFDRLVMGGMQWAKTTFETFGIDISDWKEELEGISTENTEFVKISKKNIMSKVMGPSSDFIDWLCREIPKQKLVPSKRKFFKKLVETIESEWETEYAHFEGQFRQCKKELIGEKKRTKSLLKKNLFDSNKT